MLKAVQIGLNTADLAGSLRLYSEAFGFRNSGSTAAWGDVIGVQGLGPECHTLVWWMIGADDFFQLELFSHSVPAQRPLPPDWKPSDHGWVRFGVKVTDFDACMHALARHDVPTITPAMTIGGIRHAAIRDPYAGIIIEVIEGGTGGANGPQIAYVTSSVADLAAARRYYGTLIDLPILPLESLHTPEVESLWGLTGAKREGFVVDAGGVLLEVLQYEDGRPQPADHRISDQGIMNIALATREREPIIAVLARLGDAGFVPPFTYDDGASTICAYVIDPGHEIEFVSVPKEAESQLGFTEGSKFLA